MAKYRSSEAKDAAKEKVRGIFSAFCLPETGDGRFDEKGLRRDIRHYLDVIKADGLYVHGFYGNFWLLTSEERRRVTEVVVDEVDSAVPIICRCAHASMRETMDLISHADSCGIDFISLIGPPYAGHSDAMIVDYFEHVAASTDLGLSIFNTPQAGYVISPELMARLAEIPNVCALKNDIDMVHTIRVRQLVGDRIVVVDPSEERFFVNMAEFGQTAIYTGTNYMFDSAEATPMHDYVHAGLAGNVSLMAERYFGMEPIRQVHHKWVLEPWQATGVCPISTIKRWTEQLGLTGGPVRPPLPSLPADETAALVDDLRAAGLHVSGTDAMRSAAP
ncbi:MAG: dihydrodipicolinate synthase family protein [Acidimicrobiales bacterium]